jgi:hypothetical protein
MERFARIASLKSCSLSTSRSTFSSASTVAERGAGLMMLSSPKHSPRFMIPTRLEPRRPSRRTSQVPVTTKYAAAPLEPSLMMTEPVRCCSTVNRAASFSSSPCGTSARIGMAFSALVRWVSSSMSVIYHVARKRTPGVSSNTRSALSHSRRTRSVRRPASRPLKAPSLQESATTACTGRGHR